MASAKWAAHAGYDAASRLQSVTSGGFSVTYGYAANSQLRETDTFKEGANTRVTTTRQFDYLNRLQAIHHSPSAPTQPPLATAYMYNAVNERIRRTDGDLSAWHYGYDSKGQITSAKHAWYDGELVPGQQFEYGYDEIGNRLQAREGGDQNGGSLRETTYVPDDLNRYTTRSMSAADRKIDITGLALVQNGVPTTVQVNGSAPDYRRGEYFWKALAGSGAGPNWLIVKIIAGSSGAIGGAYVPPQNETFGHDEDGNLTADARWVYKCDAENRLARIETQVSAAAAGVPPRRVQYHYDYRGRLVRRQVFSGTYSGGVITWNSTPDAIPGANLIFLYDGMQCIATLNSDQTLYQAYVWGLDLSGTLGGAGGVGGLVMFRRAVGGGTETYFPTYDGNGNVTGLVNGNNGTVAARYDYDPFGQLLRMSGEPLALENPFRFSTKWQDDQADLLYYGFRHYALRTGRWLSRDPIEENGAFNLYAFVYNNPQRYIDPFGLDQFKLVCEKAADLDRRIQGLRSNTGDQFKRVFMGLQLCILNKLCVGACCNAEKSAVWLNDTIDTFMTQFTDALDGKYYPENERWKASLERIDKLQPLTPRPKDMKYFSLGVPAGGSAVTLYVGSASYDYATGVEIAWQMALIHINQDLALALRRNTPGLDENWNCIGGVVADCQKDFFTKLELLIGKLLPKDRFDISFIRDQMRERIKDELSQPQRLP